MFWAGCGIHLQSQHPRTKGGKLLWFVFFGGGEVSQGYIVWEMLNLTQLKMLLYSRTLQGFSMLVDTLAGQSR